jgi:hypothetical protein
VSLALALLTWLGVPGPLRRSKLDDLAACTAAGFGCAAPVMSGLSYEERLRRYAVFTAQQAAKAIADGRSEPVRAELNRQAYHLGAGVRRQLGLRTITEAMQAARLLYGAIGIAFRAGSEGDITIDRCYFSRFYSGEVCRLISGLDEGVLAGLSGGGRLSFSRRLTEGGECCKARLRT